MPDLGVGSLSGPLQVLAGTATVTDGTTLLTAFATKVKVLATSSGGLLALDPGQSFGGIFLPTPLVMGETTPPTTASNLSAMWFDSVTVKLHWVTGATTANAMTLDASGNVNVAGTYQLAGTSIFATASTWSALQTFSAGLTVSAGTITFDTVPQVSTGSFTTNTAYGTGAMSSAFGGGGGNTAFGYFAENVVGNGGPNDAFGYKALAVNTQFNNVAVGYGSLSIDAGGRGNTAVGHSALSGYNASTAGLGYNTCVGYAAGSNYTGAEVNNTILGAVSGVVGDTDMLRIGNNLTTLLTGQMTGVTTADYLSIAGMIATANGGTAPTAVTVPASGTAYTPSTTVNYILTVSGGTVTAIAVNGVSTGLTSGTFYLKKSDNITFTYTVVPTVYQMTA